MMLKQRRNRSSKPMSRYAKRLHDMLPFIEEGTITAAVAQKSYVESFLGVHLLHWLNTNSMKVVADPKVAGINPLPQKPAACFQYMFLARASDSGRAIRVQNASARVVWPSQGRIFWAQYY